MFGFIGEAQAHDVSREQAEALIQGGPAAYVAVGAEHMLTGYDHLLFLFGVLFFLTRPADVVRFVTAFTVGHSLTLLGATLAGVQANPHLIDAAIAVSVAYKAFDNLDGFRRTLGMRAPNLPAAVFGFGLIHGFGLATRLQELPLPREGLVARILAFNAGVEVGQLAALLVMVPVLALARRHRAFAPFGRLANAGLVLAGCLLFLAQVHVYLHKRDPDAYGFPGGGHYRHHLELDQFDREVRDLLKPPGP